MQPGCITERYCSNQSELCHENAELYHDQEGNLHNKNNKIKQEDIYRAKRFSKSFIRLGRTLRSACDGHHPADQHMAGETPLERIRQAIDVAGKRRASSPKYIDQVLIGWEANGYPPSRSQQIFARSFNPRRDQNGEDKPRYKIPEYSEAELAIIDEINRLSNL